MRNALADAPECAHSADATCADDEQIGAAGGGEQRLDRLALVHLEGGDRIGGRLDVGGRPAGRDGDDACIQSSAELARKAQRGTRRSGTSKPTAIRVGKRDESRGGRAISTEQGARCTIAVATLPARTPSSRLEPWLPTATSVAR